MCNVYSFASLLSFTAGAEWGSERKNKPVGTRTRASRVSFTNQSALIGSTSCQGYTDSLSLAIPLYPSTLGSPPVLSLSVNFYSLFRCLFAPLYCPPPFPSFLPVCNAERWWIDMCRRTEEPIWTGVSAHLYQMLQRYILLLCFITLEWRALKCLTALSSLLRPPSTFLGLPLPSSLPPLSHSFSGCEL